MTLGTGTPESAGPRVPRKREHKHKNRAIEKHDENGRRIVEEADRDHGTLSFDPRDKD